MIRVGIIGCGSIAKQRHAYEYHCNPDVEIAGYFDLNKDRAKALADIYGGKVYETADELFADPSIDAVSVCAANAYHAENTIKALKAGKDVLCEKPMATSLADCEAMLEAAKTSGKRLFIAQNQRLAPAHVKAKEILDSGRLGKVLHAVAMFGHKGPETWSMDNSANTWFFKKEAAVFGSMADLGIHKIDTIRYLVGSEIVSASAALAVLDKKFPDGTPIEVDDNSVEIFRFENGAMMTVITSWTNYGYEANFTNLLCEHGVLKLYADPKYALIVVNEDGTEEKYEIGKMQTNDDEQQESSGTIDEFIGALKEGRGSVLDADKVIGSMRGVFAAIKSAEEGKVVEIK